MQYVETYIEARDLCPVYCLVLRARVRVFCVWLGGAATLDRLESGVFNKWVSELRESGMALNTVDGYRRCVLCIWRDAYDAELIDNPPLRIKRLKKPRIVIEAFNHAEIAAILAAADKLPGYYRNGIKRSDIMRATILCAYCTGLRRGDLLRMMRSQLRDDGTATVLQRKTGYPVRVKLSPDALEAVRRLKPDTADDRLLPWAVHQNVIHVTFAKLVKAAGVRKGQFRWLRRSAGSYAETVQPGGGARLLGHRDERMFRRHYEDAEITQTTVIEPPPLPKIAATA
jgi:integrase